MVHMMRGSIDNGLEKVGHSVIPVMYGHGPHVHEHEEDEVRELVHGEAEHVQVVGHALHEAVYRVERVRGERCWHLCEFTIFNIYV